MVALLPWPPVPSDLLSFTGSSEIKSMKKLEFRKKKKRNNFKCQRSDRIKAGGLEMGLLLA